MKFLVSPDVFEAHPNAAIGVIIASNIDNTSAPETESLLRESENQVRSSMDIETFKEHPHIAAMQEVHRSFGNNPNKFPPSSQALVKRVLKGSDLPSINPLVDLYNAISLRHVTCVGAEDSDVCEGDIRLAYADGTEEFIPLGASENDPPKEGELVYKDDKGVICRKLNWREGDRTKITENTRNAVIVVEGFPPLTKDDLQKILEELSELVQKHCKASARIEVLSKESQECDV